MGIELFLEPGDEQALEVRSRSSSSVYDSDTPDSIELMKSLRRGLGRKSKRVEGHSNMINPSSEDLDLSDNSVSVYSSFARDSMVVEHRQYRPNDEVDISCDESSSSELEDDIQDSLQYGYDTHHTCKRNAQRLPVSRRFSIEATGFPSKLSQPTALENSPSMKRRSSIDNGYMVLFSSDILSTQRVNNGGANAAA